MPKKDIITDNSLFSIHRAMEKWGKRKLLELLSLIEEDAVDGTVPISVFKSNLSALEAITKYLREEKGLQFSQIAALLNRKEIPIGVTYRNAARKYPDKLEVKSRLKVKLAEFRNKNFSPLEAIVFSLKKHHNYRQIAGMLNRDERTIWTVFQRVKVKIEN